MCHRGNPRLVSVISVKFCFSKLAHSRSFIVIKSIFWMKSVFTYTQGRNFTEIVHQHTVLLLTSKSRISTFMKCSSLISEFGVVINCITWIGRSITIYPFFLFFQTLKFFSLVFHHWVLSVRRLVGTGSKISIKEKYTIMSKYSWSAKVYTICSFDISELSWWCDKIE